MSTPTTPNRPPAYQPPSGSHGPTPQPGQPSRPDGAPHYGAPGSAPGGPPAPHAATPPPEPMTKPGPSENTTTGERPATPYGFDEKGRVQRTKISGVWIGLIAAAVLLILLIIFIAQNLRTIPIHFLGWAGHLSVGLALLIAAIVGVIMAAVPGTVRILQLRKSLRRNVDTSELHKAP